MNQTFENKASALYAWNANRGTFKTEDEAQGFLDANRAHLNEGEISRLMEDWRGKYGTSSDISTLQEEVKNVTAGNGTEGAMGYGEFLKHYGSDTQKNYSEAVKAANDAYYRAISTYGKNAESFAGAGLTGAGVSDYGSAAAWGARQGAVATAGAAKQEADAENARSFAQYLESYKAQKTAEAANANAMRSGAIKEAMALGYTDAGAATEYLKATGYFSDDEAAQYATTIANYYVGKKAEADAQELAAKKEAAVNTAVQSGLEGEALKAYLAYNGFTTEEIESTTKQIEPIQRVDEETQNKTAYTEYLNLLAGGMSVGEAENYIRSQYDDATAEYVKVTKETGERSTAVKSFTDSLAILENDTSGYNPFAEGVPTIAQLDAAKAQYGIDDETYNGIKNRICTLNEKWISDMMSMAREGDQIDRVLSNLGITATEGADNEEMQREAIRALRDRAFDLFYHNEISKQNMDSVLSDYYAEEIEGAKDAGHDKKLQTACGALVQARMDAERLGDDSFYQRQVDALAKQLTISKPNWKDGISMGAGSTIIGGIYGGIKAVEGMTSGYKIKFNGEVSMIPNMEALKLAVNEHNPVDLAITVNDYSKVEDVIKGAGGNVDDATINIVDIPTMYAGELKRALYDVVLAAEKNLERKNTANAERYENTMREMTK